MTGPRVQLAMRAKLVFLGAIAAVAIPLMAATSPAAADSDESVALSVATLLRSGRAVISANQDLINDASKGNKGLTADVVVAGAKENFKKATSKSVDEINASSLEGQLAAALIESMHEVMTEAQERINQQGVGFKGFLPAVFAKAVADKFRKKKGDVADLKLTAPQQFVRNRANRPDEWESNIIENRFKAAGHTKGQHVAEVAQNKGKNAFRLILPEYYGQSCLGCHGEPKGERDISGGQKEGAKLEDLGGAISVTLFK